MDFITCFLDYIKCFISDATFNLLGYGFMVINYASRSTAYAFEEKLPRRGTVWFHAYRSVVKNSMILHFIDKIIKFLGKFLQDLRLRNKTNE